MAAGSVQVGFSIALAVISILVRLTAAENDCDYGFRQLWSSSLRDAPLTATPLLFDVDGDGYDDIVAPSFSGEVWAVHGESGHIVDNWPFYLEDRGFHTSPLVYDIDKNGVVEFLLSTTEAEIVFVGTDGSLLHGETIKIPPLRVQRRWYSLGKEYLEKLAQTLSEQINNDQLFSLNRQAVPLSDPPRSPSGFSTPYSEFESRYGRHSDPLYSRHQPMNLPSGIDPKDSEYVYIDPHILATPTIADLDGDGLWNELVIPVSYYYDPFYYGMAHNIKQLGGLEKEELVNFAAGAIVVVDLDTGNIVKQTVLGITRAQPGYVLSTPTVVKMLPSPKIEDMVILVGTTTGELHMLRARDLSSSPGFPVSVDAISSQVSVADIFHTGILHIVTGDDSGNIYCISQSGERVWEREAMDSITATVQFADLDGDAKLEVIVLSSRGSVWVLDGQTGEPYGDYPLYLSMPTLGTPLVLHLNTSGRRNALSIIVPTTGSLFAIDAQSACIDTVDLDSAITGLQAADIDPFNPGLEILARTLDGQLLCFTTSGPNYDSHDISLESWAGEATGGNKFTHRSNSFGFLLPHSNHTLREVTGHSFSLGFQLVDNSLYTRAVKQYTITVAIGRKYVLYSDTILVHQRVTEISLLVPTPPTPIHAFLTLRVCNEHSQCEATSYIARFNLHFEDNLKWFLCLPFLSLCAMYLWLLRDEGFKALPMAHTRRKDL